MNANLGPAYMPDFVRRPKRMSPEDLGIWQRWYQTLDPLPELLYFDVGIGPGDPLAEDPSLSENIRRMWLRNTQRRIDAVLQYKAAVWIVELRYNASPNAIGRLMAYRDLWLADPPIQLPPFFYLVTNHGDPELKQLAESQKFTFVEA